MNNQWAFYRFRFVLVSSIILLWSCNTADRENRGLNSEIMNSEKPVIDTSRVLETLELYRAKRYEGIGEALSDGTDQAYKLILHGRKTGTLSPEIGRLTYLHSLDVAYNDLKEIPGEISNLHYLQGFYANGNNLQEFPDQILLLPVLEKVDLSENQISAIPPEIMKMDQLVRLTMDQNMLTSIPVQLYYLENLEILELKGNGLSVVPEGISNLRNLKKLDVADNQLQRIPREIINLSGTLKELNIQGNQISMEEIRWLVESLPGTRIRY